MVPLEQYSIRYIPEYWRGNTYADNVWEVDEVAKNQLVDFEWDNREGIRGIVIWFASDVLLLGADGVDRYGNEARADALEFS